MTTDTAQLVFAPGPTGLGKSPQASGESVIHRAIEYNRLIESLRVMLAIIAGLLLLNTDPATRVTLSIGVGAFGIYAVAMLWQTASGSINIRRRIYYWLDAMWFLMLLFLSGGVKANYFLLLFFPVFFAAWRIGYSESIAIAAFSALAALAIFVVHDPDVSWAHLLALSLSLFVIGPLFIALARIEAATRESQIFADRMVAGLDPRRGFDMMLLDLIGQIAEQLEASVGILAMRTFDGGSRALCWEIEVGSSELSESAILPLSDKIFGLPANAAVGWAGARYWWQSDSQIVIGPSGVPLRLAQEDRNILSALADVVGTTRLLSVPLPNLGIGHIRLILAGDALEVATLPLDRLAHIVAQIGPYVENAYLRERLVNEAIETERMRIGRDLHDSAIQPYIGLKFALEAVQRKAGANNAVASDLAHLVAMATEELASTRAVVNDLRGTPGKGGALLSNAVRRQASRFGRLFGIEVEVVITGEMPVSRRIAGELFHIVAEGLSNIRRHTQSRRAWISLSVTAGSLVVSISNANDANTQTVPHFTPASLTERALALGGRVDIDCDEANTTVTVRVPLSTSRNKSVPGGCSSWTH